MLPVNQLLQEGRYRVIRHLGQNDIGSIYEGLDNIFEKNITISQCVYNGRKNLADEEKILKGIKHETFLSVADYFAEPNGWFIVMEAADGEAFSDMLKNENRDISFSDVMNWAEQILDGLGYLHLHLPPVVYGDIKPQNIFLAPNDKIKMLTSAILKTRSSNTMFGKPSAEALNYSPLEQILENLDLASQKVITASFDEPSERILRQPVDARCDIYSLGVFLYQMLTKQFPKNALERSIEILEGNPDPLIVPDTLNAEIPPEVSEIILKALEIRRENRFHSAVIMRQALRTAFVRIKEREEAGETKQEEPITIAAQESFSFSDLIESKKVETIQTTRVEEDETENLSTETEEIKETEKPSAVQDFEIVNLDLPQIHRQPELLEENYAKQSNEAEAMREELISENQSENEIKKISTEFFHFDEEDEEEILEIRKHSEEIKETEKPVEEIEVVEEKVETIEDSAKVVSVTTEDSAEIISAADSEKFVPEVSESDYKKDYSPDEFSILFNESEKKSSSKWKVPVVALILFLVGSGAIGAWMIASKSGSNADGQTVTNQLDANPPVNAANQPPAENSAQANTENSENAETATEANIVTTPDLAQETAPTAKKQTAVKPKPEASKPQTASAKTPEKKEKKVTVDDLISDY
ncbi:hypothetical protein BH20ACI4_BH20ACI4_15270 [soil metagenome]